MIRCPAIGAIAVAAAFLVSACGEKVQTVPVGGARKVDGQAWAASSNPYIAPGWVVGDQASWDAQMQRRAQAQNDFAPRQ